MKPTTAKGYREKIRASCRAVGTYKPEFEPLIGRLADAYLRHRQLEDIYQATGGQPIVTAKGGSVAALNPVLEEMDRMARRILDMERELGLTPAALRRVNEAAMAAKQEAADPLTSAILSFRQGA